jgi:hypothetical protein
MSEDLLLGRESLIDFDPVTGIATHIEVDHEAGVMTVASRQQADDIIEQNKFLYNSVDERARYGEKFTRMAQIGTTTYFELWRTGIAQDDVAFKRWLNDRDNSGWRTRPGRI